MKFLCDGTVGKLAKLMRMLGLDTELSLTSKPKEIVAIALEQNRHVLSRSVGLKSMKLARNATQLGASDPWSQLETVLKTFEIKVDPSRILTRCMADNTPLVEVDKKSVKDEVFPYVYKTQEKFNRCPMCNRLYWPGTHVNAMLEKLKEKGLV